MIDAGPGKTESRLIFTVMAGIILTVYITGLFPEPVIDSAKYAAVSRQIYESGDWIHLRIHNDPYMQKPPLLFWLGAIAFKIFGISVAAFKIPTLLVSLLGIYSVYRLGALIYGRRTGLIAAILYSASESVFLYLMDVHTDMLMTSNMIFGTWQLLEYLENKKAGNFILGFIGIGLAMISKGLPGIIVPVFALAGYLIYKRDFHSLFSIRWIAGIPIIALILYPALKGAYDQFGPESIRFYFWANNIDRIKGDYTAGKHDYLFYIHTLAYVFLPWSLYSFTAIINDFKRWKRSGFRSANPKDAITYSAVVLFGIIITLSSQQSPHYLLPAIPFFAIITARMLDRISFSNDNSLTYRILLISGIVIACLLTLASMLMITYFFPVSNVFLAIFTTIVLFLYAFIYMRYKERIQLLIIPSFISISVLSFISNTVYMPSALKYCGPIHASYCYNKLSSDGEKLYTYDYTQYETYFFPERVSERIGAGELAKILNEDSCWLITTGKGLTDLRELNNSVIEAGYCFPHKKLTNISLKFLNPATREQTLTWMYLIHIKS